MSILGTKLPIILLGTGMHSVISQDPDSQECNPITHAEINLKIVKLLAGETTAFRTPETPLPVPDHILAGCFPHTVSLTTCSESPSAWPSPNGEMHPFIQRLKEWQHNRKLTLVDQTNSDVTSNTNGNGSNINKPIKHYMLLPRFEWGVASWYLEINQPYIQKHTPTIGFSMQEAFLAEKVTLVGGIHSYPDQLINELEKNGSKVVQISENGTDIATLLPSSER